MRNLSKMLLFAFIAVEFSRCSDSEGPNQVSKVAEKCNCEPAAILSFLIILAAFTLLGLWLRHRREKRIKEILSHKSDDDEEEDDDGEYDEEF